MSRKHPTDAFFVALAVAALLVYTVLVVAYFLRMARALDFLLMLEGQ